MRTINLEPGYQQLDGQEALNFVRFRHTDSDLYRNARQQLFLDELKDRLSTSLSLFQIPQLIGALKHNVEVARGGSNGTPSISEIQSYVGLGYHLKPGPHVPRQHRQSAGVRYLANAQVCASQSDVQAAVDSFMHPDITLPSRANDAALGRKPKVPKQVALQPAQITTLVLNGTTILGLARDTSYKLAVAGFHTVQLPAATSADAPTPTYSANYVYYDSVQPNAQEAAQQLKVAMGTNTVVAPLPPQLASYAQQSGNPLAIVVVGTAFGGEVVNPQAHVVSTPTHELPNVSNDPGATLASVEQVRAKVPFRIMVPHVIERSSRLTSVRAGSRVQAGAAHARARADVRHGRRQCLLERDRDELEACADPRPRDGHVPGRRAQVPPLHQRRPHPHGRAATRADRRTGS